MKTPDYLSYERYKKKKEANPNKRLLIFIATFFATLLGFMVIVKGLSPDVDVSIGDGTPEPKENGLGVKKFIDNRLKLIQMDDNSQKTVMDDSSQPQQTSQSQSYQQQQRTTTYTTTYNPYQQKAQQQVPAEQKVNAPKRQQQQSYGADIVGEDEAPSRPVQRAARRTPPRPSASSASSSRSAKVYVGRYSTMEQAKVAQEILMDSGLGITPYVRNVGSSYTLQVGSYSSRSKAEGVASELQRNSFPARIVQD